MISSTIPELELVGRAYRGLWYHLSSAWSGEMVDGWIDSSYLLLLPGLHEGIVEENKTKEKEKEKEKEVQSHPSLHYMI